VQASSPTALGALHPTAAWPGQRRARSVAASLPPFVTTVALFVDETADRVARRVDAQFASGIVNETRSRAVSV